MCEQPMCIQPQHNSSFQQSAQNVMRQVITQNTKGTSAQLCAPDKTYAMGVESLAILQASFGTDRNQLAKNKTFFFRHIKKLLKPLSQSNHLNHETKTKNAIVSRSTQTGKLDFIRSNRAKRTTLTYTKRALVFLPISNLFRFLFRL